MGRCAICGADKLVSNALEVCVSCLRTRPREALDIVKRKRASWRVKLYRLPPNVPNNANGVKCSICVNECMIPEGGLGYCGIWTNKGGKLAHVNEGYLISHTYLDPHPTNCVATPVCPAATARGYPKYTHTRGVEVGYYNLAVFMGGCPLDCAFCQNWIHKYVVGEFRLKAFIQSKGIEDLVEEALQDRVTCVCYFGGDPTPHIPLLLKASKLMLEAARREGRVLRICWETDGQVNSALMKQMALISLESGGIVKIDWKAWTPSVYEALTGVDGVKAVERLKRNTRIVAGIGKVRREPPLLVVSILLVPGYVDSEEVRNIARYISRLMKEYRVNIPLVLLAFYGEHLMKDLPTTSIKHAIEAFEAAKSEGIREVYIGNEWLLDARPS